MKVFEGCSAHDLTHTVSPERFDSKGHPIQFDAVTQLIGSLRAEVSQRYLQAHSEPINFLSLGARAAEVRNRFYRDPRFQQACDVLEISPDQYAQIPLPWWSVKGCAEGNFDESALRTDLVPRHSYETQLMRHGVTLPIKNVSVAGLVLSAPNAESPNGKVMLGIRAGLSYPQTYHLFAGALQCLPELMGGRASIFDTFCNTEFQNELGMTLADIAGASFHARLYDTAIENGVYYLFKVQMGLSAEELTRRWEDNPHVDQGEHHRPIFVDAQREPILSFIREHYRGLVSDKPNRTASERCLLHPAALGLAALVGIDTEEFRDCVKEPE